MIIDINSQNPQRRLIRRACQILKEGGVIAYPTDTFYGIGCAIQNKKGIEIIKRIKDRPKNKPFSILCDDLHEISRYAKVSNYAYKTMKRLLPGPYTFILEATKLVPKIMLTKRKEIGIRIPDNNICRAIVKELSMPIISSSADYETPYEIEEAYKGYIDMVIDGGVIRPTPSSVISLVDDIPHVLREGKGDVSIFYG